MDTDKIHKETVLHAPLATVWRALADSHEFGSWFGASFEGPFAEGAVVHGVIVPTTVDDAVAEHQKPFAGTPFEITIVRMQPECKLSFRWCPLPADGDSSGSNQPTTLVEFTLTATSDGVLLTVTESGFDQIPLEQRASAFSSNEAGWAMQMQLIAKYLSHAG